MRLRSVVLPEPRNPVSTVTGIRFSTDKGHLSRSATGENRHATHAKWSREKRRGNRRASAVVRGVYATRPARNPQQRTNRPPRYSQTSLPGRSPDSRAHLIHAGKSPSRVQGRSGFRIRRHSFTVAGAAPGLVLVIEEHAPASRFTRRRSRQYQDQQQ